MAIQNSPSSSQARRPERKREGDAAKGWVQKSLFVLRTPFFEETDYAQCKLKAFPALYSFPWFLFGLFLWGFFHITFVCFKACC